VDSDQATARAELLFAPLLAVGPDGARLYSEDDVLAFALALLASVPALQSEAAATQLALRVAERVGAKPETNDADLARLVTEWLASHPVPPALLAAIGRAQREGALHGAELGNAFAAFAAGPQRSLDALRQRTDPQKGPLAIRMGAANKNSDRTGG
jgi:hypothetical protein